MIDTNLFVAAVKRGRTKSREPLLRLLDGPWELVADDDILVSEYRRYAEGFQADAFLKVLLGRVIVLEQREEDIAACKPFFPSAEGADIVHAAATCRPGRY